MIRFVFMTFVFFFVFIVPAQAVSVQELDTSQGITIWLSEDHSVPVVSMDFAFEGGITGDPEDKLGLANLLSDMLVKGAGEMDEAAFYQALDDLSISISFQAGRDYFMGSLKTLSKNQDKASNLLQTVLNDPRFDEESLIRSKESIMAGIRQNMASPGWLSWRNFNATYYEGHAYSKPGQGTLETIPNISKVDLQKFVDDQFAKENLTVAIAGDINPDQAIALVTDIFHALPIKAKKAISSTPVLDVPTGEKKVEFDGPQTTILMGKAGLSKDDPDYHAGLVANYLIGGGSFSSALMQEARVKKGLTYGISSSLLTQKQSDVFIVQTSTAVDKTDEMLETIDETLKTIRKKGFSHDQIADAKSYLIGSLPLALTSTGAVSGALLSLQLDGLPSDYLNKRRDYINSVKSDDVSRVTHRLLSGEFLTVLVGP